VKPPVDYPIDNAKSSFDSVNIDGAANDSVVEEPAQIEGTLAALRHRYSINKPVTPEMIDKARLQMNTAHANRHESNEHTGKHSFSRFLKVFR